MNGFALNYISGTTPVHTCDARVKIIVLLAYSVSIFIVQSWWGMGAFALAVIVLAALARIPVKCMAPPLVPVVFLALFAAVFAFVADPGVNGLLAGAFVAVRMIALVAASLIVCSTTSSTELLDAFAWFIGPLRVLHVPVRDISFTLSLAIRFIPMVAEEFMEVRKAQVARGAVLDSVSFRRKLQVWGAAFSAVFIGLFRRASNMSAAMDARCFGASDSMKARHGSDS